MIEIELKIQDAKDADKALFPHIMESGFTEGALESVGILEAGMASGKPSVWLNVKLPEGSYACAQISGEMLGIIAGALWGAQQRWSGGK